LNVGLTSPLGVTVRCGGNRSIKCAELGCLPVTETCISKQPAGDLKTRSTGHQGGWTLQSAVVPKRAGELCEWA